jgi:hypothetical protein
MGLVKQHFKGATRQEMEQAGRALPKKIYTCGMCGAPQTHDGAYKHQVEDCPQRPGSTVKAR